ncbi:hypothetical protein [Acinetobacter indicus]
MKLPAILVPMICWVKFSVLSVLENKRSTL